MQNLEVCQPRDDYREFLELAIVFLGGTPIRETSIQAPGALHSARWMTRVIYCYIMWMFRTQFKLKAAEKHGIFQFLLFVSDIYIKVWYCAPIATEAPRNDLQFLKQMVQYVNPVIKNAAMTAFKRHL